MCYDGAPTISQRALPVNRKHSDFGLRLSFELRDSDFGFQGCGLRFTCNRPCVNAALSHPPIRPPEQHRADRLEDEVRQPHDQVRGKFCVRIERMTEQDEAVVHRHQH